MRMVYKILYRNGVEDVISVDMDDVDSNALRKMTDVVEPGFREGVNGKITIGNRRDSGTYIRLDDVIRVSIDVVKEGD